MRDGNTLIGGFQWRTAPLGAGGFIRGMDISSDGELMVHSTDVWGGYLRRKGDTKWTQVINAASLPSNHFGPKQANGAVLRKRVSGGRGDSTYGFRIAPSDKDILYMAWNAQLFRSPDGGATWVETVLPPKAFTGSNGFSRLMNPESDVHPTDPDIVIFGTGGDGVWYSTDGFLSSYAEITLPDTTKDYGGAQGKYLCRFDPSNPSTVYVHVYGVGLYRSTTGLAGTFSLLEGSPLHCSHLVVTPAGQVFICYHRYGSTQSYNGLWKMNTDGTWSGMMAGTLRFYTVAVNPFDEDHIVGTDEGGSFFAQSYNGGASWVKYSRGSGGINRWIRGDGEVQWFSNMSKRMYPSMLLFDPVINGKLYVTEGVGIAWSMCKPEGHTPSNEDPWLWHDFSRGNEELIPSTGMSQPGKEPMLIGTWDKGCWRMESAVEWTNTWSMASNTAPNNSMLGHARSFDYAIDNPDFLAGIFTVQAGKNGTSLDYGQTWTKFNPEPVGNFGGCIAVGNQNNLVIAPGNNAPAYYCKDYNPATGAGTWLPLLLNGVHVTHWLGNSYTIRRNICADKERPGVFAAWVSMYNPATGGSDNPNGGIWISEDGGANWVQTYQGIINNPGGSLNNVSTSQSGAAKISYVPGFPGELVASLLGHSMSASGLNGNKLLWSQDDGASWVELHSSIKSIQGWAFGKAAPGNTRPTVGFWGHVSGVKGAYAILGDWGDPPTLLAIYPNDNLSPGGWGSGCEGDLNHFGRFYIGHEGSGYSVCDHVRRIALT